MAKKRKSTSSRLASRRRRSAAPEAPSPRPANEPAPGELTPEAREQHRELILEAEPQSKATQQTRGDELRINMMRSIVTEPLLTKVQLATSGQRFDVIITLNEQFKDGTEAALEIVQARAKIWNVPFTKAAGYLFAQLTREQVLQLADEVSRTRDTKGMQHSVIYRIWEDNEITPSLTKSIVTVKADAAQRAFHARGDGITWAVLDSGIQADHPHFKREQSPFGPIDTLKVDPPFEHEDFTPSGGRPMEDLLGHGTHVAGVIAGYWVSNEAEGSPVAGTHYRNESPEGGEPKQKIERLREVSGVAPACRLVSLKVIADRNVAGVQSAGKGKVSWVLRAIDRIQSWNEHGKRLSIDASNAIHGVNMSLGYDFDPRWFGCGQSPLCVEVNRLVKSGVVVVVSAGNGGYSSVVLASGRPEARYNDLSITDPGNAELAITVGSTHREKPHLYGISYFSSRGPTGDGRCKPDLVAPGERILSCAVGEEIKKYEGLKAADGTTVPVLYGEQSGTSMAAPHVSGAIAAFLSVRREFIGAPERVKDLFLGNTVDLRRERSFQGAGLLDLMKVLQAI